MYNQNIIKLLKGINNEGVTFYGSRPVYSGNLWK